jgi:hypothetical protein
MNPENQNHANTAQGAGSSEEPITLAMITRELEIDNFEGNTEQRRAGFIHVVKLANTVLSRAAIPCTVLENLIALLAISPGDRIESAEYLGYLKDINAHLASFPIDNNTFDWGHALRAKFPPEQSLYALLSRPGAGFRQGDNYYLTGLTIDEKILDEAFFWWQPGISPEFQSLTIAWAQFKAHASTGQFAGILGHTKPPSQS